MPARPTRFPGPAHPVRAAVIVLLVILAGGVTAASAQAASFRFWGYFQQANGTWAFAQKGPAQTVPKDGTVEGWRYAVADESSTRTPRATPTFDSLCAGTAGKADTKRIGLVIDFGRAADGAKNTPPPPARATCVAVPTKATGSDVLVAAGATLRIEKALTCAIDGWPATGCGESVASVPAAAAAADTKITIPAPASPDKDSASSPWILPGGIAAVALIAALGFGAWRRGRDATDD